MSILIFKFPCLHTNRILLFSDITPVHLPNVARTLGLCTESDISSRFGLLSEKPWRKCTKVRDEELALRWAYQLVCGT